MASKMSDAIKQLIQERGISEDLVRKTIEESLLAAYKNKYGSMDNAVVRFSDDGNEVTVFSRKKIVEEVEDPVREISLSDAIEFNEESEIGDELLIEVSPKEFDRSAVQSAKQKTKQTLREIQRNTLYSEFKERVGEMIIGYYQRERNGNIFVDLGKTEGILPKKFQSPREVYHPSDRIRALIYEVSKSPTGLQIVLTRTHGDFVKKTFELEVPELYDRTIEIYKIVREPGYRTKMAVYSNREDVDPVGACVGLKGVRIQAVVRELEGEKIDVLRYDPDPRIFIKNALLPAEVKQVIIVDESKKSALAIVADNQFSLAIGKQGLNVRLANRLVDWNIDVKTEQQFAEMDLSAETKRAVSALFGEAEEEEIEKISELPDIPENIVEVLKNNGIEMIEDLVSMTKEEISALDGIGAEDAALISKIIDENVEIVEEEAEAVAEAAAEKAVTPPQVAAVKGESTAAETAAAESTVSEETTAESTAAESTAAESTAAETAAAESRAAESVETEAPEADTEGQEEETYECPECGAPITTDMTACPNCGVGLSFEEEEEE
ncbi:MAG: transcription termination/antitermination protein NusA [Spirochaetaceae bacterium]|nr:MAG: transcription termination/antitermination protein NusA [Spirochaetaceae bacterium]